MQWLLIFQHRVRHREGKLDHHKGRKDIPCQVNPCLVHVTAEITAHGQSGRSQKIRFPAVPQVLVKQEVKVLWQGAEPAGRHPCIFQPADKVLIVTEYRQILLFLFQPAGNAPICRIPAVCGIEKHGQALYIMPLFLSPWHPAWQGKEKAEYADSG